MSEEPQSWAETFGLEALPEAVIDVTDAPRCYPHNFTVHEKERQVTCSKCDTLFDAFDALMVVARSQKRFRENANSAMRFTVEKQTEAADLQRKIRNLRSMKARAGEPLRVALRLVVKDLAELAGHTKVEANRKLLAALAVRYESWDPTDAVSQTGTKGKGT